MGFFGELFFGFLAVVVVLGIIGLIMTKRKAARSKDKHDPQEEAEVLPEKVLDNVLDLNDRFNRARYMDTDQDDA